ncbi:MAG: T9SS type A sorting domain-containing protein [Bacteroidetes bacterium]|nr:T9SS type A sorting domain-containing protein [Bacteroidota bacterium]
MKTVYNAKLGRLLRNFGLAFVLTASANLGLQAQGNHAAEANPDYAGPTNEPFAQPDAQWSIQLDVNATAPTSSVGMAGAHFVKNSQITAGEFWTSKWASDTLLLWDAAGVFQQKFTIAGLTGVRSLAFDGTYIYAGTNTTTIYRIDPVTRLLAPPHINSGSVNNVRHCSYDATLDGGNGGFWVGNFGTDVDAISMSGAVLSSIPAATHGLLGMYGSAYDGFTAGGPYLWIFDQSGANTTQIERITLATGATYGLASHDVFTDFSGTNGLTSGLAGGLFITDQLVSGQFSIGGMIQGTPNNVLFSYELADIALRFEEGISGVKVFPNPSQGKFTVQLTDNTAAASTITVRNAVGQEIRKIEVNPSAQPMTEIDLGDAGQGIYFIHIQNGEKSTTRKMVVAN